MGLLDIFKTERSKIHLYGETIVKHALGETIVIGWPCLACLLLFYGKVTHLLDAQIRVSLVLEPKHRNSPFKSRLGIGIGIEFQA